jgi:hypothetical protein
VRCHIYTTIYGGRFVFVGLDPADATVVVIFAVETFDVNEAVTSTSLGTVCVPPPGKATLLAAVIVWL